MINRSFAITLIIVVLQSCGFKTDLPQTKVAFEGLSLSQEIVLGNGFESMEMIFVPTRSSAKYEARLLYSEIPEESLSWQRFKNYTTKELISSLDGFEFELRNPRTEQSMCMVRIIHPTDDKQSVPSFGLTSPLILWLKSELSLDSGTSYQVRLVIPPARETKMDYRRFIFQIRIAPQPYP